MTKYFFSLLIGVIMSFGGITCVSAQTNDSIYEEKLGKLLEASGAMAQSKAILPKLIDMEKQQYPLIADSFWDKFQQVWDVKFNGEMVKLCAPVYKKYLTIDDLDKIIEFYESPTGKKMSANATSIVLGCMQMGEQLSKEIVAELQLRLKSV